MRYTLLEMVQVLLRAMNSDEVNSINDTVESLDLANLIRNTYYDMTTELRLSELGGILEINASGSSAKPCYMSVPNTVTRVEWIKYDNKNTGETTPNFLPVRFVQFEEFLKMQQSLRLWSSTLVGSQQVTENGETFELMYRKDKHPQFFTTIDGTNLYFDSYNNTIDTTLQKDKTLCYGFKYPVFTISDSFEPDLDPTQFSLLLNKAKVRAFQENMRMQNPEAIRETRLQKIALQSNRDRTSNLTGIDRMPKYGRK